MHLCAASGSGAEADSRLCCPPRCSQRHPLHHPLPCALLDLLRRPLCRSVYALPRQALLLGPVRVDAHHLRPQGCEPAAGSAAQQVRPSPLVCAVPGGEARQGKGQARAAQSKLTGPAVRPRKKHVG